MVLGGLEGVVELKMKSDKKYYPSSSTLSMVLNQALNLNVNNVYSLLLLLLYYILRIDSYSSDSN